MKLDDLPRDWEAVVVGAGIAGSAAALRLARHGVRVLLVEQSDWPRDKVCGGCVNAAALRELEACGLTAIAVLGQPYSRMHLAGDGREASFPLPPGRAVTRRSLDDRLVARAIGTGACFLPATRARLGATNSQGREVELRSGPHSISISARLVLDSGGLAGRLSSDIMPAVVSAGGHIGVGTVVEEASSIYPSGTIYMACGRRGYVGLVRAEEGRVNVGAALDPVWTKRMGGPALAVTSILAEAGFPSFHALHRASWRGTPRLTRRRRRLGAERLLILGDAAGYVEPFTGEGMAWALADAAAVEPLALAAVECWRDDWARQWTERHGKLLGNRQRVCRSVAWTLHHPRLLAAALPLIAAAPGAVAPLTAWFNRDFETAAIKA